MQAIEFIAKAHDGVVDLPRECLDWDGKKVRVTLVEVESEHERRKLNFKAVSIATLGYHFDREEANAR